MRSLLERRLSRLSIGLVVDARRIAICVMRISPIGRRILTHEVHDRGEEPAADIVRRLLEPWVPPRQGKKPIRGPWVQLGIPESQAFLSTVPITQANRNATAQAFFLEAVQATNIRAEDRIIDLTRIEVDQQPLACIAASPAEYIRGLVDMVSDLKGRVGLIQHNPMVLFRAGTFHAPAPRGSKLCLRFFLGSHQAIGVLAAGDQPLFWHSFKLEPGREEPVLLSAYSTLWMLRRNARIEAPIDTIVIHGRPELSLVANPEEFRKKTGARLLRCDEPGHGIITAALGLALMDPLSDEPRHDLGRGIKPTPTIGDIFPWAEVALHGALIGAVSLAVFGAASDADARLRTVQVELSAHPWAKSMDQRKLDDEKKQLDERLKAIATFRGGRVKWSAPLRSIAGHVPDGTVITSLSGEAGMETSSKGSQAKVKKQLEVGFETPLDEDGLMPHEIDGLLASLRGESSIKRYFPLIAVTGLRANPTKRGGVPAASYKVVCLPPAEKAKAAVAKPSAASAKSRP